jgi:dTDP-glucose pyrophosphorylase
MTNQKQTKRGVKHHRNARVHHCISAIYEDILYKLRAIKQDETGEIEINDIIHQCADNEYSKHNTVEANFELIADLDKYNDLSDAGVINESEGWQRAIEDVAFFSLRQAIEEDNSFLYGIINKLSCERIDYETAQELIKQIEHEDKTADNAYREYEV